ncbi:MAG: PKD domain-containing protein, partial [Bacteroidota bacterium]
SEIVDGARYGFGAAMVPNFNYNNIGARDLMRSEPIDLSGFNDLFLELDYAYRRRSVNRRDSLVIKLSTNGGASFPHVLFAATETGNGQFATVPDGNAAFFPADNSEWCFGNSTNASCIQIDLNDFRGEENVVVSIENSTGFGNNLFVDNFLIVGSCEAFEPPVPDFESNIQVGCAPLLVNFFDLSQNDPFEWTWTFPGGNPSSSSQQDPVVSYANPGQYDVTLTVTNAAGTESITKPVFIEVLDLPIPNFDYQETSPLNVQFENLSIDADTYLWDFGDGNSSNNENPVHSYDQPGQYTVSLTAFNDCGSDVIELVVSLLAQPVADFSADPTNGCAPLSVNFTDNSAGADEWFWEFDGGIPATSTLQNPIVEYANPGMYNVVLSVTNDLGSDTEVKLNFINVQSLPTADFTFNANGLQVSFNNLSQDFNTVLWDFGDGNTSNEINPVHVYSEDGDFEVTLTVMNDCGIDVYMETISLLNLPIADIISDLQSGCAPLTVSFMDNSSGTVDEWLWEFEGGTPMTSVEANPTVQYLNEGSFDVTLTVTNALGSNVITLDDYISVLGTPEANFSYSSNMLDVTFNNLSVNYTSIIWDFGDGNSSNEVSPVHSYLNDGTYTVTLRAINDCGEDELSMQVQVGSAPAVDFTANLRNGCNPLEVVFMDQSSSNVLTWNWSFPGGMPSSSNEQNPTVIYNTAGSFDVCLTVSSSNG